MNSTFLAVKKENIDDSLFPKDWQIVYDPLKPTNREIDAPLTKGETEVTIIDYYIFSPNIELEKIETFSQNFQYSDHEPVFLKIKIK